MVPLIQIRCPEELLIKCGVFTAGKRTALNGEGDATGSYTKSRESGDGCEEGHDV
jgi:hypothetical protein